MDGEDLVRYRDIEIEYALEPECRYGAYMEYDGIVDIEETSVSERWHTNPNHGKTYRQLTRELLEVATEGRKRRVNRNDTEDQWFRAYYLRDARAQLS
ncbi:hypothetical protein [Nocardia sp. NPDC051570]|uniref:hypothetical protein n=1 Tax=Nocardia sp. NPDC051570 TaxID=3364324 RepID=UPI0037A2D46D